MLRLAAVAGARSSARGRTSSRLAEGAARAFAAGAAFLPHPADRADGDDCGFRFFPPRSRDARRRRFGMRRRPHRRPLNTDAEDFIDDLPDPRYLKTADEMMDFDPSTDDWGVDPADFVDPMPETREEREEREARMEAEAEEEEARRRATLDELDSRTGRLWTDPWEIEERMWYQDRGWDDAPDWTPDDCSRVSRERLRVLEEVPTLGELAKLAVPPGRIAHPADQPRDDKSAYLDDRDRRRRERIRAGIEEFVPDSELERIMAMEEWADKQDAIDELYEETERKVKEREDILGVQPRFGEWVEQEMERYLTEAVRREREAFESKLSSGGEGGGGGDDGGSSEGEMDGGEGNGGEGGGDSSDTADSSDLPTPEDDAASLPLYVNLLPPGSRPDGWPVNSEGLLVRDTESVVPDALHPLTVHRKGMAGRLVEEWELCAHPGTRHVMLRGCVRDAARMLWEADKKKEEVEGGERSARILLTGKKGCGKTSALIALVASARASGYVVLYLPDGDRLRHLGKYIQPNKHRRDDDGGLLFDLPWLSKEVCGQLLRSHEKDLEDMTIPGGRLDEFFGGDSLRRFREMSGTDEEGSGEEVKIVDLLRAGAEKESVAPACYSLAVDHLLRGQDDKPFLVAMDEFNCYFDHLHYFHMAYDDDVRYGIPPQRITLFKPLVEALGVHRSETIKGNARRMEGGPRPVRRGGIVAATTESRAVAPRFTDGLIEVLTATAEAAAGEEDGEEGEGGAAPPPPMAARVDVPAYSNLEVEHALANFEVTGVGRLRFDRGSTVMDEQEVAFLRMVSGGVPQNLLDACVV